MPRRRSGNRVWRRAGAGLLGAALLALPGCLRVVSQDIDYYKDGPYQVEGPHGVLPRGTHVWVVGHEGSYARVWTLKGLDAYVWDKALVSLGQWKDRPDARGEDADEARPRPAGPLGEP